MARVKCQKHGEWFTIETGPNRQGPVYKPGSILLFGCPFSDVPLELSIAVTPEGEILFRHWEFCHHTTTTMQIDHCVGQVDITPTMLSTLRGLASGRIKFRGLALTIGEQQQTAYPVTDQTIDLLNTAHSAEYAASY